MTNVMDEVASELINEEETLVQYKSAMRQCDCQGDCGLGVMD